MANRVRLSLFVLAYLGNFLRRLCLPKAVKHSRMVEVVNRHGLTLIDVSQSDVAERTLLDRPAIECLDATQIGLPIEPTPNSAKSLRERTMVNKFLLTRATD